MRTLDVTQLSNENLGRLCAIEQLNWGVLNESVVGPLLALRNEVDEQRKEILELTNPPKHAVLHPEEANANEIIKRIFPESKQFPPSVKKGKLRLGNGKENNEVCDIPDGMIAHLTRECGGNVRGRHQSGHLGELMAVVGLRGGSRVTGFRRWGWRMFRLEIGPIISRLLWAITPIAVHHLLRSSCHLGLPNVIGLMRRSRS
jgi:hypothetical protein